MKNKHSFVEFYTTHVLLNKIKHKVYLFLALMPIINFIALASTQAE